MPYKGTSFKTGLAAQTPGTVITDSIIVRNGDINKGVSVFVKISAGALTSLEVYESIDGVEWLNPLPLASYQGSSEWAVLTLVGATFPAGTTLQLRCVTAGVTIEEVRVVQDW